ncbi:MAG: CvpA family protein [Castellaniella sp.]|uniref:CvpA family protein n=1 Tax=Castellaniella sp. TaxID=1955812 RepID=UPI0012106B68|nr:CvpA family protein [Castellaniella sp.]TAN30681.1 MAG: CvpA family protein [Castellaniella sp.]
MTSFDYVMLAVVAVSALIGLLRGFLREVLSLIAYIVAFVAAIWWGPPVSNWLTHLIDNGLLRTLAAYGAVFIVALMGVGLLNMALGALVDRTGLTPADHGLGALFGTVRGFVLVLVLVGMAGYTQLPQEPWWQQAKTASAFVNGFKHIKSLLPPGVAELLPY